MPKSFSSLSITKTFKYWYLLLNIWTVSSLGFLYMKDFNPDLMRNEIQNAM